MIITKPFAKMRRHVDSLWHKWSAKSLPERFPLIFISYDEGSFTRTSLFVCSIPLCHTFFVYFSPSVFLLRSPTVNPICSFSVCTSALIEQKYLISTTTVWVVNSGATIAPAMLFVSYKSLISKKDWIELLLFKKWGRKFAAAAILLGPKKVRVLVRSQCEITQHELSNASLRIFELLGGMHSTKKQKQKEK